MQTMKTVSAVVALVVLMASLGLSGCANQAGTEAGALLSQDIRKMDNDELTLYYYRLTEEIDRRERSGPSSSVGIGIGGGSWGGGWGSGSGGGVGVGYSTSVPGGGGGSDGHLHNNPRGRRRRHGRFTQPPRRGPGRDAAPEHEAALRPGYRAQGQGSRKCKEGRALCVRPYFFLPVP